MSDVGQPETSALAAQSPMQGVDAGHPHKDSGPCFRIAGVCAQVQGGTRSRNLRVGGRPGRIALIAPIECEAQEIDIELLRLVYREYAQDRDRRLQRDARILGWRCA